MGIVYPKYGLSHSEEHETDRLFGDLLRRLDGVDSFNKAAQPLIAPQEINSIKGFIGRVLGYKPSEP